MYRKIAAHYTLCPRSGRIPRAILTFDESGRLVAVESDVSKMDSLQGIEFFNGVLVPGLTNAHCHLELSYLKGVIPPGTGLDGFVRRIADVRRNFTEDERIQAADFQQARMRQEGIIAVGDIANDPLIFPLKQKSRFHYHTFIELFGLDPAQTDETLSQGRETAAQAARCGLPFSVTPHSTYSLSEPLFERIVRENTPGKPLSIHFMESAAERELFQGKGAFAERYCAGGLAVDFTHFGSPAGRLIASVPAETPLLLIHNTFVTEEDIDRIHDRFNDVTWVLCPRSNEYIEGAVPPVELLRRKGCRIALGTDSLTSNTSLSLLDEMKYLTGRIPVSLDEMIGWTAANGAKALGIDAWAGSFVPGTSPGAVLIDHINWDTLNLTPQSTSRRII